MEHMHTSGWTLGQRSWGGLAFITEDVKAKGILAVKENNNFRP